MRPDQAPRKSTPAFSGWAQNRQMADLNVRLDDMAQHIVELRARANIRRAVAGGNPTEPSELPSSRGWP